MNFTNLYKDRSAGVVINLQVLVTHTTQNSNSPIVPWHVQEHLMRFAGEPGG